MRCVKINLARRVKITAFFGLFLFVAVHLFYDPYRVVETIGASTEGRVLQAGDPEVLLVALSDVKPGTDFRVSAKVAWESVEAEDPAWRTARVIFASYDKKGQWIPSHHVLCCSLGSGQGHFESIFSVPDSAASTRLVFQHLGKAGSFQLDQFSLEQVELRGVTPSLFRGLQILWVGLACGAVWRLRLFSRRGGWAVFLMAALIAGGMLIPGQVVHDAPYQMADLVRPAQIEEVSLSCEASAKREGQMSEVRGQRTEDGGQKTEERVAAVVQKERNRIADRILTFDFNLWTHAFLFLLLGIVCGLCFLKGNLRWRRALQIFACGLIYGLAAELLQVTDLTRTVRVSDFGVNALGWLTGLLAVGLIMVRRVGVANFQKTEV